MVCNCVFSSPHAFAHDLSGLTGKKEGKTRLMNMVMQLRKVTCHPYLFDGAVRRLYILATLY